MLGACMSTLRMSQSGKTSWGFHNRGVVWDNPVSKWAGEGKDLAQDMTMHPPKKNEVNIALLKMTRQPTKHLLKTDTGIPSKKRRELDPNVLESPEKGEVIQVEIRV